MVDDGLRRRRSTHEDDEVEDSQELEKTRGEAQGRRSEHRVRFSAETERPRVSASSLIQKVPTATTRAIGGTRNPSPLRQRPGTPTLSIDTIRAGAAGSAGPASAPAAASTSPTSSLGPRNSAQTTPLSPRSARNRGYSLRRTVFSKAINSSSQDSPHGSVIELGEAGPSHRPGSSDAIRARNASSKKSIDATITPIEVHDAEVEDEDTKPAPIERPATLPNYESWIQTRASRTRLTKRIIHTYNRVRKFVLRITEIPPTKDGRHIDLDAQRKEPRLDERTGKPYIDNTIRSSRYNVWNFVPRQLWAQFSRLANAYFLFVAILQMIPGLSTTGTYTTIVPLLFFVTISIAKEGYDDFRRYRLDKEENNRVGRVFRADQAMRVRIPMDDGVGNPNMVSNVWIDVKWKDVRVGDIVRVARDEQVPADMILLSSQGEDSSAYIETMALDGETNLKSKSPAPCLARVCDTLDKLSTCSADLVVEDPNLDLYNFEGRVTVNDETAPLSNNEVVYRGSVLRNTPEAVGMVIFSGEECKIRMNASKNPRIKAPSMQAKVNKIVIAMVIFVIALAVFNTVAYQVWARDVERHAWYLTSAGVEFLPILVSFIIMFNTLIPLSLYVSLEIVKVFQRLLLNDIDMYDEESDTPMEARTSTINEELGQVSYIFSDKTGTLTDNSMKFRKLSVAGTAWLHDSDLKIDAVKEAEKRLRKTRVKGKRPAAAAQPRTSQVVDPMSTQSPRKSTSTAFPKSSVTMTVRGEDEPDIASPGWRSSARPTKSQPELHTIEMIRYIQRRPFTIFAKKARFFMLSLALCHTCLPEKKADGSISYQATSPDELALVQAAQELGYILADRQAGVVTIKTFPHGFDAEPLFERYEVLDVIEFSSKRKRMSVLVRFPDQRICVLSKGADSVIMNLLRLSALAAAKSTDIERKTSIRKSVEARQANARRSEYTEHSLDKSHGRSSIGGIGRTSISDPKHGYRGQLDAWLRDREVDVDASVMDDQAAYTPRPSGQYPRHSMASSARSSVHTEDLDFELVEEALVVDEPAVIERCFQHINDFATEGLRTLLYGYRFVSEDEYQTWRKIYRDATTSLVDRQASIERAGELIEHSLELAGATAIEDKLQKGVPEAIDKLRRAGIKLWMLTGDKRETAINIGHSCRLIKDYSSITVLDVQDPLLEHLLGSTIVATSSPLSEDNVIAHSVVVIDGATLAHVEADPTLRSLFTDLAPLVDSLICCRASPAQKASLVRSIRRKVNKSITLAIGDGANDIAMIQEAHVGIGITGKEGLQAARTSDYSIAQFRFLTKLLLVHGRWNYHRTALYTLSTFWKELLFYLTQALYQRSAGYTGTSLYESWSLTTFNTLFTSLPVIILGIFDKDLAPATLLAVPELYASMGLADAAFNWGRYAWWIFLAVSEACVVFYVMLAVYGSDDGMGLAGRLLSHQSSSSTDGRTTHNSAFAATYSITAGGSDNIFPMAALTFTAVVITISAKLQFLEMHYISRANVISFVVSVGGWFLWNIVLDLAYSNNSIYKVRGAFLGQFGREIGWWATLGLVLVAVAVVEISWRVSRWVVGERRWTIVKWRGLRMGISLHGPSDVEIFQALEKDPVMKRAFEDRARGEMPSLGFADDGCGEEAVAGGAIGKLDDTERPLTQQEREGEIEEILRRRGVHDDIDDDNDGDNDRRRLQRVASGRSQSLGV